ncbi:hypothetical protein A0H81_05298 [Grifola frondosa]|uniref:Uncharacterized protein n=1 Tax=Grifola frondosa TaxID=5627 RepID=A0A1C7MDL9_GRIFR|nr:hypothetical protein A0H81_05298 [Grifola frondosa]
MNENAHLVVHWDQAVAEDPAEISNPSRAISHLLLKLGLCCMHQHFFPPLIELGLKDSLHAYTDRRMEHHKDGLLGDILKNKGCDGSRVINFHDL